ncbi:MAG: lipocalin-like domain-containing protein [Pseudomonadales bacterium]
MKLRIHFLLLPCLFTLPVVAEDAYQLLRSDPAGYASVVPDKLLQFPEDHLPHKAYRIEWWYLTANLTDDLGRDYGFHWTLFRQSMSPKADPGGWQSNQVWMAHSAISQPSGFSYEQRFARGGVGQAGVQLDSAGYFSAFLDDWHWQGIGPEPIPGNLTATTNDARVELSLTAKTPWVLQGDNGYSQKSELGQASYYYSQPHIQIRGVLEQNGEEISLSGQGWLDREWSSQPLAPDQPGWDWLSLHLNDGHALMVYQLRQTGRANWLRGTWVTPDGTAIPLQGSDIQLEAIKTTQINTPRGDKALPLHWRVTLPGLDKTFTVVAMDPDHWLDTAFPYWEGPVAVQGSSSGRGYLELTGY